MKSVQEGLSTRGAAAPLMRNLPVLFKNPLLGVILRFIFSSVIVLLFKAIAQCCVHSDIICLPAWIAVLGFFSPVCPNKAARHWRWCLTNVIIFTILTFILINSADRVCVCVSLAPVPGAAAWCSAERLWRSSSTAAAGATVMMRRTTWCWECAWMLLDFLSPTARFSTRLCLQTSPTIFLCTVLFFGKVFLGGFYLFIHLFSLENIWNIQSEITVCLILKRTL